MGRVSGGWQVAGIRPLHQTAPRLRLRGGNGISALGYPNIRANYMGGDPYKTTNPRDFDPARDVYLNSAAFADALDFRVGQHRPGARLGARLLQEERIAFAGQAHSD